VINNPQVIVLLKRYPKESIYADAVIDLSGIPTTVIRNALQMASEDRDVRPRQLDTHAIECFSRYWPNAFDANAFDFFIHLYRRREVDLAAVRPDDPLLQIPGEDGPPSKIPLPEGTRWLSVRPSHDGYENYEAVEVDSI
jgi:hypothetical protein